MKCKKFQFMPKQSQCADTELNNHNIMSFMHIVWCLCNGEIHGFREWWNLGKEFNLHS